MDLIIWAPWKQIDFSLPSYDKDEISSTLKEAVIDMDRQHFDRVDAEEETSGTTMIGALVTPNDIFLVNVGDSRGLSLFFCERHWRDTSLFCDALA